METKMLRWMAGVTRLDRIRNEAIRQKFGVAPIADKMRGARLRWYGHVLRGKEDSVCKIGLNFVVSGKRPRGRPKQRWADTLHKNIKVDFGNFYQCVTIWTEKINMGGNRTRMSDKDFALMKIYGIQNACITFYIPFVILVVCYVLILKVLAGEHKEQLPRAAYMILNADIYKTLNASEPEMSSALYLSEYSKYSTIMKRVPKKERESAVSVTTRTLRGQDKLSRAKVRSLRITLLLILAYVITWLPNNLLSWWMMISFDSYRDHQDATFPLAFLVVLNSVINPFIYGRCRGLKMMLCCSWVDKKPRKVCSVLRR
ncbi:unnamed protein product [Heligmosomoides polygyrus]|uniref:G_PROTEIN_RECEP_F1_2 domain-containing protein n=1 Tax=Heligmosomoides polygyrus TaxID=6339 RepID=A0A3P7WS27_HELPZ|nr:unnamed protein product [Heligmosomoides polygyrus]